MASKTPHIYQHLRLLSLCLLLWSVGSSCNNLKYLPENDALYTGSKVTISDNAASSKEKKILRTDLEDAIRPKPNKKFLGMRLKLSIYNFIDTPKTEKGIRNWLRNKLGEPPVLASSFDAEKNRQLLNNILINRGFFRSKVKGELVVDSNKKAHGVFEVTTREQSFIDSVEFIQANTLLSREIVLSGEKTLLKKGQPYNLELIKGERERIDKHLKEKGYYFFRPDYLIVQTDTTLDSNKVWMRVTTKDGLIPEQALKRYRIHDVIVYPNYTLQSDYLDTAIIFSDTLSGFHVVQREKNYKPSLFVNTMMFKPGEIYNRTDQNVSLSRLINLGTFKFAKNRFEVVPDTITPLLNTYYYLTSSPKKSLSGEIGALTRSDSRVGSELSVSWRNRNTFKGAELFTVKGTAGFETQYGGAATTKRPNTYAFGLQTSITFPRFLVPFIKLPSESPFMPKTIIKAGYDQVLRMNAYQIHSFNGSYGFNWKEEVRKEHNLFPVNITYVRTDSSVNAQRDLGFNYSNLIFNGLIIGPTYEFTFNSQNARIRRSNFYFNGLADLSGNILGIVQQANYESNLQKIAGAAYAQYVKLHADTRHYVKMSPTNGNIFANRLFIGAGFPYGNSRQLPNIKQFFSGGNSSLRGFRSRLVGPGTYNELYLNDNNSNRRTFIETLGDIKLELNSEFRLDVYQFIKTAIFFDAGNIWLRRDHPDFPGGKFTSNFYKEFAADLGLGLRLDFNILLLRLDLGIPVRKPWLPEGERWVFNQIDFGDKEWRRENLILNIAIGYPF